jgi:hypothetical protein
MESSSRKCFETGGCSEAPRSGSWFPDGVDKDRKPRKSDYNYHVSDIDDDEVVSVIEAAESLAEECQARLRDKGWA